MVAEAKVAWRKKKDEAAKAAAEALALEGSDVPDAEIQGDHDEDVDVDEAKTVDGSVVIDGGDASGPGEVDGMVRVVDSLSDRMDVATIAPMIMA